MPKTKASLEEFRAARAARRPKTDRKLTVTRATSEARRVVDRLLAGLGPDVNVASRLSYDLTDNVATVVPVVPSPTGRGAGLKQELAKLSGTRRIDGVTSSWIEITRER